jgi:tRNA(fMet)-specific endonuclease VapC
LLNSFRLLEINDAAGQHFKQMMKAKKRPKRRGDLLIACISLAHHALLVTRNVKDYKDVPGLRVENWAN